MNSCRFDYEDVRTKSSGLNHILKNHPEYDVRKVSNCPEYVVFFGDEEIARWDTWGQKVLTMLWGVEPQKVYKNSPEAALKWILENHVTSDAEADEECDSFYACSPM